MTTAPPSSDRIFALDFLRGVAVLGILLMNVVAFALPEAAYYSPKLTPDGGDRADRIAWLLAFIFVDGKFRGLFTLMFGASMLLIIERAERSGRNPALSHYSRIVWLAIFGLLHFFLLWRGDILFLYACYGSLIFGARLWDSETLIRRALLIYACGVVLFTLIWGELLLSGGVTAADIGGDAHALWTETTLYRQSFDTIVASRLVDNWSAPLEQAAWSFFETLPIMLLGMALYRCDFLTGGWSTERYRRFARIYVGSGLGLTAALAALALWQDFDLIWMLNILSAWVMIPTLLLIIGYTAAFMGVAKRHSKHWLARAFAAAGRMAFSNYLGTSLIMCAIFYGWGMGWFARIGRADLYLFILPAWAVMLAVSGLWLRYFRYGPLEWLWRSLSRARPQALWRTGRPEKSA